VFSAPNVKAARLQVDGMNNGIRTEEADVYGHAQETPLKTAATQPQSMYRFGLNNFDLLRILAATQVLILHSLYVLQVAPPKWIATLELFPGVPIFFVISGYLVSASYERSKTDTSYIRKRALRIFPALWVCLGLTVIIAIVFSFNFFRFSAIVWLFAQMSGVIYTPSFLADFGFGSYNGSLWTIPIELQFYIALPIIYRLIPAKALTPGLVALFALFAIVAFILGWRLPNMGLPAESFTEKIVRYTLIPHFYMFLAGVVSHRLGIYRWRLIHGAGFYWGAAFIIFCYSMPASSISMIVSRIILAIFTISMAYTFAGLSTKLLKGYDISYGVYIYHGLVLNVMYQLHFTEKSWYPFIVLVCSYFAGYFSWIVVERRFLLKKS